LLKNLSLALQAICFYLLKQVSEAAQSMSAPAQRLSEIEHQKHSLFFQKTTNQLLRILAHHVQPGYCKFSFAKQATV